ncbi:MAG: murein hydrolase activator EnvC family protein [Oscillospiraceae bacterium]
MGKRKIRGIVAAVLAALVVAVPSAQAVTTDFDAEIKALEQKAEQIRIENEAREKTIGTYTGDISENKEAMGLINDQIDGINEEISVNSRKITAKEGEIAQHKSDIYDLEQEIISLEEEIQRKEQRIAELEEENRQNLDRFAKLIPVLYKSDSTGTIPVLNGSSDWYDFFVYNDVVQNISEQNLRFMNRLMDAIAEQEKLIEDTNSEITKLNSKKHKLEDEKTALEGELEQLEQDKTELNEDVNKKAAELSKYEKLNDNLSYKISSLKSQISASNDDVEAINLEIEKLIRAKQQAAAGGPVYSSDGFRWPLDSKYQLITTPFGWDPWRKGNHYGIDVGNAGIGGQNIYAAQSGTVITAYNDGDWHGGFGNYIIIDHGGGVSTLYAHCSSVAVYEGQTVSKGDIIGYVGSTGWSTGNHLHFEVRQNGTATDPFGYSYEYV